MSSKDLIYLVYFVGEGSVEKLSFPVKVSTILKWQKKK